MSSSKLYVGSLSWLATDDKFRDELSRFGQVLDGLVMRDRDTGKSRGFRFVTLASSGEADAALKGLNGNG